MIYKQYVSILVLGIVLSLTSSLGCSRTALELMDVPIIPQSTKPFSLQHVENRIIQAGKMLRWKMNPINPGEIIGTLSSRRYSVTVFIPFSTRNYSIFYRKSTGLKYQEDALFYGKKIHKRYNQVVSDLHEAIEKELLKPPATVLVEEPQKPPVISPKEPKAPKEPTSMKDLEEWLREKERERQNSSGSSSTPSP